MSLSLTGRVIRLRRVAGRTSARCGIVEDSCNIPAFLSRTVPLLTLIQNARVFAPDDAGTCDLLVGAGRILELRPSGRPASAHSAAAVVDVEGRRVVPGFIDGHAHITGGGGESGFASRVPPVPLSRFTHCGVTSVVGVLGTDDTTRDTRGLVAAAYGLREEGMGAWCHTGGYRVPPVTLTGDVRDDIVFIDPVIGVGEIAIADHRSSQPTTDELARLASDVHVAGLIASKAGILHLHLGDGERGLAQVRDILQKTELPARVFNPTHVNRRRALFDEAIELAGRGSTVDITAFPVAEDDDGWPAAIALQRYLDAGAPPDRVTISSDGGGCLPVYDTEGRLRSMDIGSPASLLATLQELLAAGVPLEAALPAFTRNVARLLNLEDRGRIAEGCAADLLVLDDDGALVDVMAGGRWHLRNGEALVFGRFEQFST